MNTFLVLLLGVFPVVFLPALQLCMVIIVIGLVWGMYAPAMVTPFQRTHVLNWTTAFFGQFVLIYLLNAIAFAPHIGTPAHHRPVAIESWALSCFFLPLVSMYLMRTKHLKAALMIALPIGLMGSFLLSSLIYISDLQSYRVSALTPSPLIPPLWFLVFVLLSFCWYSEMSRIQKSVRFALMVMAGMMAIYSSARLILVAWVIAGIILLVYIVLLNAKGARLRTLIKATPIMLLSILMVMGVEVVSGGIMASRFQFFIVGFSQPELILQRMPRLELWSAALSIIKQNPFMGIGFINERIAIREVVDSSYWLRSHQTYLSLLVTAGVVGLISGILLQLPVLSFASKRNWRALFPAFIGLGIVLNLNFLTDSILQSTVNVQVYILSVLIVISANRGN